MKRKIFFALIKFAFLSALISKPNASLADVDFRKAFENCVRNSEVSAYRFVYETFLICRGDVAKDLYDALEPLHKAEREVSELPIPIDTRYFGLRVTNKAEASECSVQSDRSWCRINLDISKPVKDILVNSLNHR